MTTLPTHERTPGIVATGTTPLSAIRTPGRPNAGGMTGRAEMEAAVAHMQSMPDAGFTDSDVDEIRSSLSMLRCTQCHGPDEIKALALQSAEERRNTVRRMAAMPGSNIDSGETEAIVEAYEGIIGF